MREKYIHAVVLLQIDLICSDKTTLYNGRCMRELDIRGERTCK